MERPRIAINLKSRQCSDVRTLAITVHDHLTANPYFVSPVISLVDQQAGIDELTLALANWGQVGNRGSHEDYVHLQFISLRVYNILRILASYCQRTVSGNVPVGEQATALISSGFELRRQKAPQGPLEMVQNFHHFIARNLKLGEVKLRWKMTLNVRTHTNVRGYVVYRSATCNFSDAVKIGFTTAATFTDAPGAGTWYYWVVPYNCMGAGVTSHAVKVTVF